MSKWINKDLFKGFQENKKNEADNVTSDFTRRSEIVWPTPDRGTETKPKIYKGRFLPNPTGKTKEDAFYVQYYYHMFRSGEKWFFTVCPKTYNFENFCPFCSACFKLWQGTKEDKNLAKQLKRKAKFCCNWYVVSDPRDNEKEPNDKQEGKVKIYEFPSKVESKLKLEITNTEDGWGHRIFLPDEEGVDFVLNVKSTKPDDQGNTFPDYADSQFARQPKALGTEKDIDEIMNHRHDLGTYVKSLERDEEDIIKVLKDEMLWDLVEEEYYRNTGRSLSTPKDEVDDVFDNEESAPFDVDSNTLDDDEELLKELENI